MVMMSVVMAMVVVMMFMVMFSLLSWLENSCYRISEFFDGSLESCLRSLGSIILESHCPVLKSNLEILYTLLERYVLTDLLCAVLAIELNYECNFLDFAFLLL